LRTNTTSRLRLGIALGSGIARGWAHIGVLRALGRVGIEPDIVCGTSIGALVGGAYVGGWIDPLEASERPLAQPRDLRQTALPDLDRDIGPHRASLGDDCVGDRHNGAACLVSHHRDDVDLR